jgi:GntR family transcriptional regulator
VSEAYKDVLRRDLDLVGDRAVYRQIADHLREAISAGRLGEGDQLPSEAQLVEHYDVTRTTIRQALTLLKSEGLVVSQHGRGVFVRSQPRVRRLASDRFARLHRERGKAAFLAEVEPTGSRPKVVDIAISEEPPSEDIAERLDLSGDDTVIVRYRRYLIDDHPVETATSYLPASIARGTQIVEVDTGPGGIYARLEEMGHRLDHFTEEIAARMPSGPELQALALPPGVPVLHLIRAAFDTNGHPVEVCDTVMSSEVYVLDYRLPAH